MINKNTMNFENSNKVISVSLTISAVAVLGLLTGSVNTDL